VDQGVGRFHACGIMIALSKWISAFLFAGGILVSDLIETAYLGQTRAHRAEDRLKLAAERENKGLGLTGM
jgi:hypothetical protein